MSLISLLDPQTIIKTLGLVGVIAIVFTESGLFFGFFLPGDSLLFTAGFLASQGYMPIIWLLVLSFVAAVAGDNVGYYFGKKTGPKIFTKEDSFFFRKSHIDKARAFYERYGKMTIILARFVPVVRTFVPIVAGVGQMDYKTFFKFNIIGGFLWTWGIVLMGYLLGNIIPNAERYLTPIVLVIIAVSFVPGVIELIRHRK